MRIRDRWISLLHHTATGTKKIRTLLTPIGLVIFGGFTGLFVILAVLVDRWLSLPWPLSSGLSWLIAAPLIAIGVGVTVWSAFHFLKDNLPQYEKGRGKAAGSKKNNGLRY